jgi:hypothetical protein
LNQDIAKLQADINNPANAGRFSQAFRGELLDALAKGLSARRQLMQQLEDHATMMQDIKNEIADLLNKLANCAPPGTAAPSKKTPNPQPPPKPRENKKVAFQFRGFGGATFVSGNAPSTAGFDGALLFPLGNTVLVGPTAGFQWVNSSIVQTIGGGPPPSTFIHTSVGFKEGNFGGRIGFPFGGWQFGVQGGATAASSKITQADDVCGGTGPTAPPGCTVTNSTTTHDTVVGPFVGGYISHSIFPHVGIFVEYDYHLLKDAKSSTTVFDLHYSDVAAGFTFTFGRDHR